mgnify:CR=1 FL=1
MTTPRPFPGPTGPFAEFERLMAAVARHVPRGAAGTVAVLLPAIISLARAADISPSKLLMPLSFGALLGGATTLIGTPPNIIVTDLLRASDWEAFTFFSFTPIGLMLLITGVVFMLVVGRRILPENKVVQDVQRVATPQELIDLYRLEIAFQIQKNWAFNEQLAGGDRSLVAAIVFKVMPDGEIRDVFFTDRSGNTYLDESAYKAIMKSNPVDSHPGGLVQPYVVMAIRFTPQGIR